MSRLASRVSALEKTHGKQKCLVLVYPTEKTPEHDFKSDEDYYKNQAVLKFGRYDFEIVMLPVICSPEKSSNFG